MRELKGIPASPGLGLGPVFQLERTYSISRTVSEPRREAALFESAALLAKDEISSLALRAKQEESDILIFQKEILNDNGLLSEVLRLIGDGIGAAQSVELAAGLYADKLRAIPDEYLSQRAGDVLDVCHRVVGILDGRPRDNLALTEPSILITDELMPGELASADKSMILGIVMSAGSTQSHTAIIARTYGIPTVVQMGKDALSIPSKSLCALDAAAGLLLSEPDEATVARFAHRIHLAKRPAVFLEELRRTPCRTKDGVDMTLLANCSAPQDISASLHFGAQGVGLLRSEFLFLDGAVPDEDTQYRFYSECLAAAGGRPVTIRTLDIGADKKLSGVSCPEEENPALGLRGLRLSLARPALLRCQLAALLRAGVHGNLQIMFPMVTTVNDLDRARTLVCEVAADLAARGVPFAEHLPLGCMIETPAAALCAAELAQRADFFSIGTNDLTQYTNAADRLNPTVADYFDCTCPAVCRLIGMTADAAAAADIPVSICGEAAADPTSALIFARLGVRKLSMAAIAIDDVKLTLNDAILR